MIYQRRNNRLESRNRRVILGAILILVIIFGILQLFMPRFFPTFFTSIARPFWRLEFAISEGGFRSEKELLRENEALKLELADLHLEMSSSTLSMLRTENRDLYALFGRSTSSPSGLTAAAVLARPSFLPYDELVIDIGSSSGVSTSSLVYAPGRVLIGKVVNTLSETSKVILFSSPKQTFQVGIGPSHITATAIGRGGGQYAADVPHGTGVQVGDVVTDGTLHDRAFGVVVSVKTDPANPFDTVFFAPPVNIHDMRFVLVD